MRGDYKELPMRIAIATWDGAGNLPPLLALIEALTAAGHDVTVMGHDVQLDALRAAGARAIPLPGAPQVDQGEHPDDRSFAWVVETVFPAIARDFLDWGAMDRPDAVIVDCMLPDALAGARAAGLPTAALLHAPFGLFHDLPGAGFREPILGADLALCLSSPGFDRHTAFPGHVHHVRPPRPVVQAVAADGFIQMRPDLPLVVASLSSGYQAPEQPERLQRIADALAMLPVEGLLTTGRGIDPDTIAASSPVTVRRSVPHEAVLPVAAVMISHGGHGSVMAALEQGVPLVCLPAVGDQPANAARIAALGLGVTIDPDSDTAAIAAALRTVLDDPGYTERAQEFAREIASLPGIDHAVTLIEQMG
jgi:UDP:flavonoid glycosyltransferase YjiC (YdhE family)